MIAGRPKSNNEASDFKQLVVIALYAVSSDTKRYRLLITYVYGVSIGSHFIRTQLCTFLDGK